jgi:rhomboid protease GluP
MMREGLLVWTLIGINVLIWLLNVLSGMDITDPKPIDLLKWGGNNLPYTVNQPWRLFTSTFLHGGIAHLGWNMLALVQLGLLVQRFYGTSGFLLTYVFSGVAGSIASLFFGASNGVSVGASGAIFGLLGALMCGALTKKNQLGAETAKGLLVTGVVYIALNLFMGFTQKGIDNAAHIGGFFAGILPAYILAERFDRREFRSSFWPRLGIAVVVCAATVYGLWRYVFYHYGVQ